MARVVLVGVGSIGRYHLLGLAKTSGLAIQAVDRLANAITAAQAQLADARGGTPVVFLRDISESWREPDLTIVATQAAQRACLMEALIAHGHRTFIIEKLVTQCETDYERIIASVHAARARAWVVAPRRYNPFYQELDDQIHGDLMAIHVSGGDMGLGTNVVHFADLFAFLRGRWDLQFTTALMAPELLPNKRGSDLVEFGGTLIGRDTSRSVLSVTNLPLGVGAQTVSISTAQLACFVNVPEGRAYIARRDDGWRLRERPYDEAYVSGVTPLAVTDILRSGTCRFPSLDAMFPVHAELFRAFRLHLAAVQGRASDVLPLT